MRLAAEASDKATGNTLRFRAFCLLILCLIAAPAAWAQSYVGYQGQRVSGAYTWGWPHEESQVFASYAEALAWTTREAAKPGYDSNAPAAVVADKLRLWFSEVIDGNRYDYYGRDLPMTPSLWTETNEPRYCYNWTPGDAGARYNRNGLFIYDVRERIPHDSSLAYAWFNNCQVNQVWYGIASYPLVAVHEVRLMQPPAPLKPDKNLGPCEDSCDVAAGE